MNPLRSRVARLLAGALALLALGAPASLLAQASQTTGAIRGRVTGTADAPIVGAVVSAVNSETGLTRNAQTDESGSYVLRLLPSGVYRVTARRLGSAPEERTGVRVTVGTTTTLNVTLRDAAVQLTTVQVSADPVGRVDVAQGGVRQNVSQEEINNLPTLGRDFTDFVSLSGLVSPTPETTTGGQFSIAGQRPSQTNLQIDGVDANNAFFGENRGGSRIPFNFSIESVREFQVITNGYDVEYGNYSGGVVNIVSRGGTNQFRGSVYGNYRGEGLTGTNFNGTRPNNFQAQQYAARVEGPIVRDKLFYLFSLDGQRRREPFVPNSPQALRDRAARNQRDAAAATSDTARARLESNARSDLASADSLTRFISILQNRYGVTDPGSGYDEFETSNDVLTLFGRLDWNINDRHRLSVRNNFSSYNNLNETFAAVVQGGLSKAENFKNRTNSAVAELTSALPAGLSNVLRVQYSTEHRPREANNRLPELRVTNIGTGLAAAYAGASISFNNDLLEDKVQVVNNLSFERGRHTLKLGTNNVFSWFENAFWNQGSGFYTFDNLAALEAQRPSRYTRSLRPDLQPPVVKFGLQEYSVYGQDDWQLTPKLLLQAGVRYDVSRYGDRPGRVVDVERAFGLETGLAPVDDDNVSPRLSLTYDVRGNASEVVRVGGGLFYGRAPAVLAGNVASTEVPLLSLDCSGSIAENEPNAPPAVEGFSGLDPSGVQNPTNCRGTGGVGGVPEYSFWTRNFELPQTLKANVGYERLLGASTRASVDYVFSATENLYTVRNLNLRPAQFTLAGEGGRQVFVPAGRFSPATAATADRLMNTELGNIFVNYTDGVARSHAVTFNVDHRFGRETSLRGSYTYTTASDNSSFSCCTAFEGFTSTRVGAPGPNVIGAAGDESGAWGPSAFVRNHTVILSGYAPLPLGFRLSGIFRMQSGTPWGPEQGGDLNGDGVTFNDRPFIYAPDQLPISTPTGVTADSAARFVAAARARYAGFLDDNECIGKHVGQIIPRNTCRQPWFNRLDVSLRNRLPVPGGRSAELQIDLFNVLNGLNKDWGRYEAVTASNRNLVVPSGYDAAANQILYTVPSANDFGRESALGTNLLLQFSAQVGVRFSF